MTTAALSSLSAQGRTRKLTNDARLKLEALEDVPLAGRFVAEARARSPDGHRAIYEVHRRMITVMIDDVVRTSRERSAAIPSWTAGRSSQPSRPASGMGGSVTRSR